MLSVLKVWDEKTGKYVGIPAIKGVDGKDYILTESDKQEIADIVISYLTSGNQ